MNMKASFLKRFMAYILDIVIISFLFSIVTIGATNDTTSLTNEYNSAFDQYDSGEITIDEYADKVFNINYEMQDRNFGTNIVQFVLSIGYFVVFAYLNKGQTIGKKVFKIRVVRNDGEECSIWNILMRSLFIYSMITLIFSFAFVKFLDVYVFAYGLVTVGFLEELFAIVAFLMVLYRKDGRGLHDLIAGTKVIEEVK